MSGATKVHSELFARHLQVQVQVQVSNILGRDSRLLRLAYLHSGFLLLLILVIFFMLPATGTEQTFFVESLLPLLKVTHG